MSLLFTAAPIDDTRAERAGRHDFDFLHGAWSVTHRRLCTRLADDTRWQEFAGICECRPVAGGIGNVDDNLIDLPDATYRAATLRLFDPVDGLWSIWWADGRRGRLDPPLRGRFVDGIGTFFGDDLHEGRPVRVRFVWTRPSATTLRWEQAFSPDAGSSWEINWVMTFARLPGSAP